MLPPSRVHSVLAPFCAGSVPGGLYIFGAGAVRVHLLFGVLVACRRGAGSSFLVLQFITAYRRGCRRLFKGRNGVHRKGLLPGDRLCGVCVRGDRG